MNGLPGPWAQLALPGYVALNSYIIGNRMEGSGAQESPRTWTVYGSTDATTWTQLAQQSSAFTWANYQWRAAAQRPPAAPSLSRRVTYTRRFSSFCIPGRTFQ